MSLFFFENKIFTWLQISKISFPMKGFYIEMICSNKFNQSWGWVNFKQRRSLMLKQGHSFHFDVDNIQADFLLQEKGIYEITNLTFELVIDIFLLRTLTKYKLDLPFPSKFL